MVIMMDSLGIETTYIVLALITAVIAGLCWLIVRNHPSEKELPSIEEIVSEETGGISLAEGGILKQHLAPETLERLLTAKLMPAEAVEEKKTLRQRVREVLSK